MQQHFPNLNLDISAQEVFSSFEFLKSLNPAFKNLNQIETLKPKDYSLNLVPQKPIKALKELRNSIAHNFSSFCSFFRPELLCFSNE